MDPASVSSGCTAISTAVLTYTRLPLAIRTSSLQDDRTLSPSFTSGFTPVPPDRP